jgi:hypothetical protein
MANEVLGPTGDPRQTTYLYDDTTPEGVADLLRWRRELREAAGGEAVTLLGPQYREGSFDEVWSRVEASQEKRRLPLP